VRSLQVRPGEFCEFTLIRCCNEFKLRSKSLAEIELDIGLKDLVL